MVSFFVFFFFSGSACPFSGSNCDTTIFFLLEGKMYPNEGIRDKMRLQCRKAQGRGYASNTYCTNYVDMYVGKLADRHGTKKLARGGAPSSKLQALFCSRVLLSRWLWPQDKFRACLAGEFIRPFKGHRWPSILHTYAGCCCMYCASIVSSKSGIPDLSSAVGLPCALLFTTFIDLAAGAPLRRD